MTNIKAIIFDWGRVLWDPESPALFSETLEVLNYCFEKYPLGLVTLSKSESPLERRQKIKASGVEKYFKFILAGAEDKGELFKKAAELLNFSPANILVVDDRIRRMDYVIKNGFQTVWLQKGKFSCELPDIQTGFPKYTIKELREVINLLTHI